MSDSNTFNVVTTGKLEPGFELADVQPKLIAAMKLKPEQAAHFFDRPRVVKKGQTKASAEKICAQLARMGVSAEVQDTAPAMTPPPPPDKLVFEDSVPASAAPELAIVDDAPSAAPSGGDFACPKCGHVQVKKEQCESCGVWFHKLEPPVDSPAPAIGRPDSPAALSAAAPTAAAASQAEPASPMESRLREAPADDSSLSPAAIGAALAAALVGAWVWKFVAITFELEIGFIAWGIGGAVGAAAAGLGSKGMKAGVVCAVIALGSIVLGKYWSFSSAIEMVAERTLADMGENADELFAVYEEQLRDAQDFALTSGSDDDTREFMIRRDYSRADDAADVSEAELENFRTYYETQLRRIDETNPSFDEWQRLSVDTLLGTMTGSTGEISILALMREDLSAFDFIFAFLGIGTAFRLGSKMG